MIDERERRRATFQEGTPIRLADGQCWTLPRPSAFRDEPVLETLLEAVGLADDEAERLRDALALAMFLLSRNYHLDPEAYPQVLGFRPGDPAQAELVRTIRRIALEAIGEPRVELTPNPDRKPRPSRRRGAAGASAASPSPSKRLDRPS